MHTIVDISSRDDRERGQALVEYGFILALVALVTFGALSAIGTDLVSVFPQIVTLIEAAL
jgi:Flp pilus assembly pilin Flp